MKGRVKKLTDRGFGFITSKEYEKDVFFHVSSLERGLIFADLKEGDHVTFEIEETDKGVSAIDVGLDNEEEKVEPMEVAEPDAE